MAGSQEWIGNVHGWAYGSGLWCKHKCLSPRNLRRLRVARGRSQEDLALDAEVDRTYMTRLERARVNPSAGVLEQIAAPSTPISANFLSSRPKASCRQSRCAVAVGVGSKGQLDRFALIRRFG
jgi:DNA-binding XRE family transcriptional regulator